MEKKHIFSSIREFEREYLPELYKKSMENVKDWGVALAKESLDKIRKALA